MQTEHFFKLTDVIKTYKTRDSHKFNALDKITLNLKKGIAYGIVGESGSGKTTLGRVLAGLISVNSGSVEFEGKQVKDWAKKDRKGFSKKVQVVFQNPYQSLDPKWKVKDILKELPFEIRREKIRKVLMQVDLSLEYLPKKPGALSGGERQRVAIARSLVMDPEFLILDEPTSSLDVSVQADVMMLLSKLKNESCCHGLIFITHDISLASSISDEIIVMYNGEIIEHDTTDNITKRAKENYTKSLIDAMPSWPPNFTSTTISDTF